MTIHFNVRGPVDLWSDGFDGFLEILVGREHPPAFLELRSRRLENPARLRQHWFPTTDLRGATDTIRRLGARTDVYVGVAPRRTRHGGKAAITHTWVLWADLDQPTDNTTLARLPVAPGVLVASGSSGHHHLYWPLTRPASVEQAEHANRTLAHAIGADNGAVLNAATILRPPATLNHKTQPATAVRLEHLDPTTHPLAAILANLPNNPAPAAHRVPGTRRRAGDPLLAIEPAVYVEILTGQHVPAARKISCPFHTDTTPSLHAYPTPQQGWACYGCARGGSIYDLAATLWLPQHARSTSLRGGEFLAVRQRLRAIFIEGKPGTP